MPAAHTTLPDPALAALVAEVAVLRAVVAEVPVLVARITALEALAVPKLRKPTPADVALHRLLREWVQPFGRDFLAAEVDEVLDLEGVMNAAIISVIGAEPKGRVRRLGKWLQGMAGIEIDGVRLVRRKDDHNTGRWAFELATRGE